MILLPLPPECLGLQVCDTLPSLRIHTFHNLTLSLIFSFSQLYECIHVYTFSHQYQITFTTGTYKHNSAYD
jgi:hypothetical protein